VVLGFPVRVLPSTFQTIGSYCPGRDRTGTVRRCSSFLMALDAAAQESIELPDRTHRELKKEFSDDASTAFGITKGMGVE